LPLFVFWIKKRPDLDMKALARLFILGAVFYGGSTAMYFESSRSIGTGLAMVIFFAYPIVVVFLSAFFHKTPFSLITFISLILIVLGCTLIAFGEKSSFDLYGITLAILSGIGYATYVFFSKQASKSVAPTLATFVVCLGGTAAFIPAALLFDGFINVPSTPFLWTNAILFSLMGTVLPVMLMLLGLKTISASKASIISVLEPVTTLGVGALILSESVSSLQYVGALIILCSAIFVQLEKETDARR
jgi:drug/metabolite transporter (DMT)-like permease